MILANTDPAPIEIPLLVHRCAVSINYINLGGVVGPNYEPITREIDRVPALPNR